MSSGFSPVVALNELEEDQAKLFKVNGISMVVIKHKGQVYALNSRCPHMGCSLANGELEEYLLKCPCHGWRFDIRTGEYQVQKGIKLETYETKVENGQILVKAASEFW